MTSISLSATNALLDLMPGRGGPRKALAAPRPVAEPSWLAGLLLPQALLDRMARRARQRELEAAFARLAETSDHLLVDIGVTKEDAAGTAPGMVWTRTLPAPAARAPSRPMGLAALSRSRRRLLELDDRLLADAGLTRAQAREEARRPAWKAPDHWMR